MRCGVFGYAIHVLYRGNIIFLEFCSFKILSIIIVTVIRHDGVAFVVMFGIHHGLVVIALFSMRVQKGYAMPRFMNYSLMQILRIAAFCGIIVVDFYSDGL